MPFITGSHMPPGGESCSLGRLASTFFFFICLWQSQQMSQTSPQAGVILGVFSRFLKQRDSVVRAPRLAKPEALSIITPFMLSQTNHQSQA